MKRRKKRYTEKSVLVEKIDGRIRRRGFTFRRDHRRRNRYDKRSVRRKRKPRGVGDEGEEENEEFSKDTRGSMTAIGASCLWKSTISLGLDTIDDNDPLLTKERLGAVREFLKVSKSVKAFGAGRFRS